MSRAMREELVMTAETAAGLALVSMDDTKRVLCEAYATIVSARDVDPALVSKAGAEAILVALDRIRALEEEIEFARLMDRVDARGGARREASSRVYFVRRSSDGRIKIGYSSNVDGRIKAIASELRSMTGARVLLDVLATIPGRSREEADLHDRFSHLRRHGEWFDPGPDLLALIASIRDGA